MPLCWAGASIGSVGRFDNQRIADLGSVSAVSLEKHDGRYFLYIPVKANSNSNSIWVIHAGRIDGPWSEPVDLVCAAI